MSRRDTAVAVRYSRCGVESSSRADSSQVCALPRAPFAELRRPYPKPIMIQRRTPILILAAAGLALSGCSDPSGPPVVDTDDLLFIRQAAGAPALATVDTTFWARRGEDMEVRLEYVNGRDCLRFELEEESLLTRPDGTPFAAGDSVQIRIRLVDPELYNFEFSPAGLRFSSEEPAELRVSFRYADRDVDGDGDVDDQDEVEFDDAGFWKQETPASSWMRIGTGRFDATEEMRAELEGFTRYALASN